MTDGARGVAPELRWVAPGASAVDGPGVPAEPGGAVAPSTDRLAASVRRVHAARAAVSAASQRASARRRLLPPLAVGSAALIGASGVATWVTAGVHGPAAPAAAASAEPVVAADDAALATARQQVASVEQAIAALRQSVAASAPAVPAPSGAPPSTGGAAPSPASGGLPALPPLPTISVPAPAVHATTGASTVVP